METVDLTVKNDDVKGNNLCNIIVNKFDTRMSGKDD